MNQSDLFVDYLPSKGKPKRGDRNFQTPTTNPSGAAALARRRIEAGLCVTCGKPNLRGKNRCIDCTKKAVASNKRRKEKLKEIGFCIRCSKPWKGETLNCTDCLLVIRNEWNAKKRSPNCYRCSNLRDSEHKACASCRKEQREYANARRNSLMESGKCLQCKSTDLLPKGKFCKNCFLRAAARRWLGSSKRSGELLSLIHSQNFTCPYTGDELVMGENATVDHIFPRSAGGVNSIENLQWTTWQINRMKTDIPHDEFVKICHLVAKRFPV